MSHYLGLTLMLLAIPALAGRDRWRGLLWLAFALLGLGLILGSNLGVYPFFFRHFPGFKFFRFPDKFFLFSNFGFILLAIYGYEFLSARKQFFPLAAAAIIALLLIYPLRPQEFGHYYHAVTEYLFRRNVLRISVFFLAGLGLILLAGKLKADLLGVGLALVVFLDLFFAHHRLNPVTDKSFFLPNAFVRELLAQEQGRIIPTRIFSISPPKQDLILQRLMDPVLSYKDFQNSLESGWAIYFGLNNIKWTGTFYPVEVSKYKKLFAEANLPKKELILARSGVKYLYYRDRGFTRIPGAFPKAMIFYQARAISERDQIEKLWSDPDFPAGQVLLIEAEPGKTDPGSASPGAEQARIVEYQNEKVTVEAEAKEAGWLLLLDSYYPGWRAEVDGWPVEIYRADGFFRAVKIPGGKYRVAFSYFPAVFRNSAVVSGIGIFTWLGLMAFSFIRSSNRRGFPRQK